MLIREKVSIYGKRGVGQTALIRYFRNVLEFIQPEDERDEIEKDIWKLKKLNIEIQQSPINNVETLNFKKISQPDIREEVKKAIFFHLKYEKIATIQRELIEKYLVYKRVEKQPQKGDTDDLIKLRNVLESVGKIYQYTHLGRLFLSTDFPKVVKAEFKVYSDEELKRLNAHITKMDEQIARCMIIHQMLGNRISDTLTLQRNCLFEMDGQDMITIHQMKTRTFEKSLQYGTLECKVMAMITREKLCDDHGKFGRMG